MKPKLAAALIAMFLLTMPAVARADKIQHRGGLIGVPGTHVKFAVKTRGGEPRRINNMAFIDVPVTCEGDGGGTIDGFLLSFRVRGHDFTREGKIEGEGIQGGFLRVEGDFSRRGRRASGTVRFSFESAGGTCATQRVAWRTRKR